MYDFSEVNQITDIIDNNINDIFKEFKLKLYEGPQAFQGPCPLHATKNQSSFCYYHNKNKQYKRARWRCFSQSCHSSFVDSSLGLLRGLLSVRELDWTGPGCSLYSFKSTLDWAKHFFKINGFVKKEKIEGRFEERKFELPAPKIILTKDQYSDMIGESRYFRDRGFPEDVLKFYQIGQPKKPISKFYFREFVPIYDLEGQYIIGATCRSVFEKCPKCLVWHDPKFDCPNVEWRGSYCKWKNWEFNRAFSLYNFWYAKKHIQNTGKIILVESPGNVWRLWDAGFRNCIATYGTELAWAQIELLKRAGAEHLYLLYDNDKAGELAFQKTGQKLWQDFYIHKITIPKEFGDIGEIRKNSLIQEILDGQL